MIVLDTNVLSALMQTVPDTAVVQWINTQAKEAIWTTAITVFELYSGIAILPAGRRRQDLQSLAERLLSEKLENRVLPFDTAAAHAAATLKGRRKLAGKPVEIRDTQIAGIVLARNATLVTRNVRDFADLDIPVINPWAAA